MNIKPNKYIEKLKPYKVTPQEPWLSNVNKDFLKLDWNEGSNPPDFVKNIINDLVQIPKYLSWYPDYNSQKLCNSISKKLKISELQVLTFPGSDVALETVCRTFISQDDNVLAVLPSYSNFLTFAESCGCNLETTNLEKPYIFSAKDLIEKANTIKPKILYLVSPNNPCGYVIKDSEISLICDELKETLVICDQAYIEFSPLHDLSHLINEHSNLVITRTFSKAYSLAGIRIGYCISNHNIIKEISKIRNGKNVSMIAQEIALECLKNEEWLHKRINIVNKEKEKLYEEFAKLNIPFYKSMGNFILFEPNEPKKLITNLKARGIFIRDLIQATEGGLRVTIVDKEKNMKFIKNLKEVISKITI